MQTSSTSVTVFDFCPLSMWIAFYAFRSTPILRYRSDQCISISPSMCVIFALLYQFFSICFLSFAIFLVKESVLLLFFPSFFKSNRVYICVDYARTLLFCAFSIYFHCISTTVTFGAYFDSHHTALSNEVMQSQYSMLFFRCFNVFLLCFISL